MTEGTNGSGAGGGPAGGGPAGGVQAIVDLGFTPVRTGTAEHVEFVKDRVLPDGTHARIRVLLERPTPGSVRPPLALLGFVVATQATVAPAESAIEHAPEGLRDELYAVLGLYGGAALAPPRFTPAARTCVGCGEATASYYVINEDAVCLGCVQRRKVQP